MTRSRHWALVAVLLAGCAATPEDLVRRLAISEEPASYSPLLTVPPMVARKDESDPGTPVETVEDDDPRYAAHDAAETLAAMGLRAFPALVEAVEDGRQSILLSHTLPGSVGNACYRILLEQVHDGPFGPGYLRYTFLHRWIVREWWQERQGRSLRELRIEAALFSFQLAHHDQEESFIRFYQGVLRDLGVQEPQPQALDVDPPQDFPSMIDALETRGKTYLELRIATERAERTCGELVGQSSEAFPYVLRGLERPDARRWCEDILIFLLEEDDLEWRDLGIWRFGTADRVLRWRTEHPQATLADLKIRAAEHALEAARPSAGEQTLKFLEERLRRFQAGK